MQNEKWKTHYVFRVPLRHESQLFVCVCVSVVWAQHFYETNEALYQKDNFQEEKK